MDNPFEILIQQNAEILQFLRDLKGTDAPFTVAHAQTSEDVNMTMDEAAKYLNKAKTTIQRYKNNGVFPYYQAGRTVFFKKSEVDAAMSSTLQKKKGAQAHG